MKPFRSLRLAPSALLAAVLIQAAGSLASPPPPPLESIWINLGGLIAIPGNPPVYKMHFVFSYGGTTFYDQWATPGYNPTSLNQRPTQGFARGQKLTLTATLYDATTGAQLGSGRSSWSAQAERLVFRHRVPLAIRQLEPTWLDLGQVFFSPQPMTPDSAS